jgi:hypothetical protein
MDTCGATISLCRKGWRKWCCYFSRNFVYFAIRILRNKHKNLPKYEMNYFVKFRFAKFHPVKIYPSPPRRSKIRFTPWASCQSKIVSEKEPDTVLRIQTILTGSDFWKLPDTVPDLDLTLIHFQTIFFWFFLHKYALKVHSWTEKLSNRDF